MNFELGASCKLAPAGGKMYDIDQNGNVIVDVTIDNGHLQKHKECGCGY